MSTRVSSERQRWRCSGPIWLASASSRIPVTPPVRLCRQPLARCRARPGGHAFGGPISAS